MTVSNDLTQKDIMNRFKDKLEDLKIILPPLGKKRGTSCAAITLTNILDVLNIKGVNLFYFNNLAVPFSGFGTYKNDMGWKGPCGAVSAAMAAIGIIMGGKEVLKERDVPLAYGKAILFASKFEQKFGSLSCEDLCGFDLQHNLKEYVKNRAWENKCMNFVSFAIEQVYKSTRKELKSKWQ